MSNSSLDLSRLVYELEEELVSVVALKTLQDLRIDGISIQLIEGQEAKLPLWIAEILEQEQYVKQIAEEMISPRAIKELVHKEQENRAVNPVDSLLFRRVRKYIEELRNKSTSSALRKLTSIEGNFHTLMRLRFRKIMQYAAGGQLDHKGRNSLSAEELWLYQQLYDIFEIYTKTTGLSSEESKGAL